MDHLSDQYDCSMTNTFADASPNIVDADEITRRFFRAFETLLPADSGLQPDELDPTVSALRSNSRLRHLNGVATSTREADPEAVLRVGRSFVGGDIPWSVQLRCEPTPELIEVGRELGLNSTTTIPLMVAHPDPELVLLPGIADAYDIHTADSSLHSVYFAALVECFEMPEDLISAAIRPEVLDIAAVNSYLAYRDEAPIGTGMAILDETFAGLFNIAVHPHARRTGTGRAITQMMIADAVAAGADTIYLQSSDDGAKLYSTLGFETVETWTYLD
jgi:ribosomal protein S18 acetylase RimI-like enzyme